MIALLGGTAISPKGMRHLVADTFGPYLRTACGLTVGDWEGWGKPARKLEDYPLCRKCSIHNVPPAGKKAIDGC